VYNYVAPAWILLKTILSSRSKNRLKIKHLSDWLTLAEQFANFQGLKSRLETAADLVNILQPYWPPEQLAAILAVVFEERISMEKLFAVVYSEPKTKQRKSAPSSHPTLMVPAPESPNIWKAVTKSPVSWKRPTW